MSIEKKLGLVLGVILSITAIFYFSSSDNSDKPVFDLGDSLNRALLPTAPEISTPNGFINTDGKEITLGGYRNKKVVLLDIWTYSCINCQRTIPYLNDWYEKYSDKGLEIIGLHTPEFAFEHKIENVQKAVEEFGIKYPVVLDNDFSTWRELGNRYWPRKYLIDIDGKIIYDHVGEGAYEETERAIQQALGLSDEMINEISKPEGVIDVDSSKIGSPEIYFGAFRNERLSNGEDRKIGIQDLTFPKETIINNLYLDGTWDIQKEYAELQSEGGIKFRFEAKNVYMVLSSETEIELEIYIDGNFHKKIDVKDEELYTIFEGQDYDERLLEIKSTQKDLKAFTFTFG